MAIHKLRLGLAVFWAMMGVVLLLREFLLPENWYAQFHPTNLTLGGWMSLALAGWNGARWYQYVAWRKGSESVTVKQSHALSERRPHADYEYNPDFDFMKPTGPESNQESGGKPNTSAE